MKRENHSIWFLLLFHLVIVSLRQQETRICVYNYINSDEVQHNQHFLTAEYKLDSQLQAVCRSYTKHDEYIWKMLHEHVLLAYDWESF